MAAITSMVSGTSSVNINCFKGKYGETNKAFNNINDIERNDGILEIELEL
jgi:hypothetical protein